MMEEELVIKSKRVSAGLLRERCDENGMMKDVSVSRQAIGNVVSFGISGEYHHLLVLV